jgi:hypothetical protein
MIKWIDELDSAVSAHKRQFGTSPRTERISPDRYRHAALLLEDAVIHRQPMTTEDLCLRLGIIPVDCAS